MKVTLIGRHTYLGLSAGALMWEYQTLALPFRRWGVKPHSGSTAGFFRVKSCSISIPSGFFCCNFMFCLIVQSGRCDFHVTFYPSVFLYQKGKQKGLGLLQRMVLSILTVRNILPKELSPRWAQKAHFLRPVLSPTSSCSPLLQIRILWEWLIKR